MNDNERNFSGEKNGSDKILYTIMTNNIFYETFVNGFVILLLLRVFIKSERSASYKIETLDQQIYNVNG